MNVYTVENFGLSNIFLIHFVPNILWNRSTHVRHTQLIREANHKQISGFTLYAVYYFKNKDWANLNCPFYITNIVLSLMNRAKSSCRRTDAQKRTFSLPQSVGNKIMACVIKTATSVPKDIPLFSSKWR
jgi:hypothetical protein